jgi:hypothetical protein
MCFVGVARPDAGAFECNFTETAIAEQAFDVGVSESTENVRFVIPRVADRQRIPVLVCLAFKVGASRRIATTSDDELRRR